MASKIKVDELETVSGSGVITVNQPLSGSGASLTSLPAGNLTGSLPAISGAALTGITTGKIVQAVNVMNSAVATTTGTIAADDTIPQITEGGEFMTLAITPTSASNILKIDVHIWISNSIDNNMIVGLFNTDKHATNAQASQTDYFNHPGGPAGISFTWWTTAGTTSATTWRVRAGGHSAGTCSFNGSSGSRRQGGVGASSITIMEIAV
jgi:hypothetical protein